MNRAHGRFLPRRAPPLYLTPVRFGSFAYAFLRAAFRYPTIRPRATWPNRAVFPLRSIARLDSAHGVSNLHALRRFAPADGWMMHLCISRAHVSVVAARFIRTRFIFVGLIRPRSPGSVARVRSKRARLADRGCPNLRWTSGLHSRLRSVPATLRAPHFRGPRRSERRRIVPALGFASFRFVGTALTAALRLPSTSVVRGSNRARSSASAKPALLGCAARRGILRARRDRF
jgi:hypothetical protein